MQRLLHKPVGLVYYGDYSKHLKVEQLSKSCGMRRWCDTVKLRGKLASCAAVKVVVLVVISCQHRVMLHRSFVKHTRQVPRTACLAPSHYLRDQTLSVVMMMLPSKASTMHDRPRTAQESLEACAAWTSDSLCALLCTMPESFFTCFQ